MEALVIMTTSALVCPLCGQHISTGAHLVRGRAKMGTKIRSRSPCPDRGQETLFRLLWLKIDQDRMFGRSRVRLRPSRPATVQDDQPSAPRSGAHEQPTNVKSPSRLTSKRRDQDCP